MAGGGDYTEHRRTHQNISGALVVGAATGDTTLVTVKSPVAGAGDGLYTIFIQIIKVWITTSVAQSWSFEDNAGTPIQIYNVPTSPGLATLWSADFGSRGCPLTENKNFVLNVSAAGLAGTIEWEGYQRMTSTGYLISTR